MNPTFAKAIAALVPTGMLLFGSALSRDEEVWQASFS